MYVVKNNTNFKCHNCGADLSLNNFIKKLDTTLHKQYTLENLRKVILDVVLLLMNQSSHLRNSIQKKLDLPKAAENPYAKNT